MQPAHGYRRRCVEPALHRYLDWGIIDHGVARVRCPDRCHEFLVAFSCKLRGLFQSCLVELAIDVPDLASDRCKLKEVELYLEPVGDDLAGKDGLEVHELVV